MVTYRKRSEFEQVELFFFPLFLLMLYFSLTSNGLILVPVKMLFEPGYSAFSGIKLHVSLLTSCCLLPNTYPLFLGTHCSDSDTFSRLKMTFRLKIIIVFSFQTALMVYNLEKNPTTISLTLSLTCVGSSKPS